MMLAFSVGCKGTSDEPSAVQTTGDTTPATAAVTVPDTTAEKEITTVAAIDVDIPIDATNFPDDNWRAFVLEHFDGDENERLSAEEIDAVGIINVAANDIADLKGIEFFTSLEELNCINNRLHSLDLSKNTKLKNLNCSNFFKPVDVIEEDPEEEIFYSTHNQISVLDLSMNEALETLYCGHVSMTELDVSKNEALTSLYCAYNHLKSLNIGRCRALVTLSCDHNELKALPIAKNLSLISQLP